MTNKILIAGVIGLALALGCDEDPEGAAYQQQEEIAPDPYATERTETELDEQARLNRDLAAEEQSSPEPDVFGQPEVGAEPEGSQAMELTQGQPMSRRSGNGFDQTLRTLRRELQNADFVVAGVVPLQLQPQPQQPQQQQPAQQEPPGEAKPEGQQMRAELLLFANRNALGDVQGDPLTVLGGPTAILVYEDQLTGDVLIGFEDPELVHIVDASIGAGQQQQGATQQPQRRQPTQQQQQGTQPAGQQQQGTQPAGQQQPEGMEAEENELDY